MLPSPDRRSICADLRNVGSKSLLELSWWRKRFSLTGVRCSVRRRFLPSWADSRPTGVAQGTVGIDRRPGIRCYAVSSSPPVADYWGVSGWRRSYVPWTLFRRRDHRTAGGSTFREWRRVELPQSPSWEEACAHFMRCGFPACGQAEGLRLLDLPGRTEDADQVCAAAILRDEPKRLISRDRETTCEQNGT
jgi:hypothetical protein